MYKCRDKLREPDVAVKDEDETVLHLRFLWIPYKAEHFYFELVLMALKVAQAGLFILFTTQVGQTLFLLLVTAVGAVAINSLCPFLETWNNVLAVAAQWAIGALSLLVLIKELLLTRATPDSADINSVDVLMICAFWAVPVIFIAQVGVEFSDRICAGLVRDARRAAAGGVSRVLGASTRLQ